MPKSILNVMISVSLVAALGVIGSVEPVAVAAGKKDTDKGAAKKGEPRAIIKTKFGEMELKFFQDKAPGHVENFLKLSRQGFYDGTIFHRVIPGFMIQGGDPNTKDPNKKQMYGTGGPGYSIKAEFNDIPHKRGIVSMARSRDPNSAGSQFFIVVEDSRFLDRQYTAFGEVVKGIGVADKIVSQPRDMKDNPDKRIEMTVVVVE